MQSMYYIGLDVHKRTISYCVKDGSGKIYDHLLPHAAALKVAHPLNAAGYRSGEKEKRSRRREQDLRLLAV